MPGPITREEVRRRFTYVSPDAERAIKHDVAGGYTKELALRLLDICPNPSRELALALTHLEQVRMYANMAIATNVPKGPSLSSEQPIERKDFPRPSPDMTDPAREEYEKRMEGTKDDAP